MDKHDIQPELPQKPSAARIKKNPPTRPHHPHQSPAETARLYSQSISRNYNSDSNVFGMSENWSVPWSDLMMVMFILFAILYATQLQEKEVDNSYAKPSVRTVQPKANSDSTKETRITDLSEIPFSIQEVLRLSEKMIADANLENIDVALTDKQAVKISVRGPLFFDSGSATLRPKTTKFLSEVAQIIALNDYEIQVVGHTDDSPISTSRFPSNWELSSARAASVTRSLIKSADLDPGRFTVVAHAMYRPTAPNTIAANKKKNRRVEIIITRNEYQP